MTFDFKVAEMILVSGIGGISVRVLTSLIKNAIKKAKGIWAYLASLAASAAATAAYLIPAGWNWLAFIVYTAMVFVFANGFYRASHKPTHL